MTLASTGSGDAEPLPAPAGSERHILRVQEDLWMQALRMAGVVEAALTLSVTALIHGRPELAAEVKVREREIDRQEVSIESECLRVLALYEPVASDFRRVLTVMRVNRDLERISDLAARVAKRASKLTVDPAPLPLPEPLEALATGALDSVRHALDALAKSDAASARAVIAGDRQIDQHRRTVRRGLTESIRQDPARVEDWLRLLDIARHLERIGDHATSIAESVVYLHEGRIIRHAEGRRKGEPG
jgi:phosphate transport system protein